MLAGNETLLLYFALQDMKDEIEFPTLTPELLELIKVPTKQNIQKL